MYIPASFRIDDPALIQAFIRRYSFATLVTADPDPFITHLPLLLEADRGPQGTLVGHVAKPNLHWQMDHALLTSVAIFHGPHAYISPSWYRSNSPAVPTWNYSTVHAHGKLKLIEETEQKAAILARMVKAYESPQPSPWQNQLPPAVQEKMVAGIIAFEMPIERLEGKFKLSQNRVAVDQVGAIEGLEKAGDDESAALAAFARDYLKL